MTNDAARRCGLLVWKESFQITREYLIICEESLPAAAVLAAYVFRAREESGDDQADPACLDLGEDKIGKILCDAFNRNTVRCARNYLVKRNLLLETKRGPHNARRCWLNRPLLRSLLADLASRLVGENSPTTNSQSTAVPSTSVAQNSATILAAVELDCPTGLVVFQQRSCPKSGNSFIGSKNGFKHGGKNTTSSACVPPTARAVDDDGTRSIEAQLQDPEVRWRFDRLQRYITDPPIAAPGREKILEAAARFDFTLAQLESAFKDHRDGRSRVGGIVRFAQNWPKEKANSRSREEFPECVACGGTCVVFCPGSPWNDAAPCTCMAQSCAESRFPGFEKWAIAAGTGVLCERCRRACLFDTEAGRWRCECDALAIENELAAERKREAGAEAERAAAKAEEARAVAAERERSRAQREAEETRRQTLKDRHMCPDCEGNCTLTGERCLCCRDTGEYWTTNELQSLGKCPECWGTLNGLDRKPCRKCGGDGKSHAAVMHQGEASKRKPGSAAIDAPALPAAGAA